jgi:hypothetical protein
MRVKAIGGRPLSLEDVFVHRVMTLEQQEAATKRGAGL